MEKKDGGQRGQESHPPRPTLAAIDQEIAARLGNLVPKAISRAPPPETAYAPKSRDGRWNRGRWPTPPAYGCDHACLQKAPRTRKSGAAPASAVVQIA